MHNRPVAAKAHWLCAHAREAFRVAEVERNVNNKHCERVNVTMGDFTFWISLWLRPLD